MTPKAALAILALALPAPLAAQDRVLPDYVIAEFGAPPAVPDTPHDDALRAAIRTAFVEPMENANWGRDQSIALAEVAASGDPRVAWIVADLMRFSGGPHLTEELAGAAATLLGIEVPTRNHWGVITDHLIAWDVPAPPDYLPVKRAIFTAVLPEWSPLFARGDVDWRLVSWGGVPMDARPFGTTDDPCRCIPAADDPEVQPARDATWLRPDDIVFGIVVNGEARAYPRRIMEVREMVNDTLGGRDLGIPYCTLCGAAQAWFTDRMPEGFERPTLRTSGLLIRSKKVMFDLETMSVLDTFLGTALTGPLAAAGVQLEQAGVVTTEWAAWVEAHPDTTVLVEALALGRDFDFRNGRDANGPIFPVGDVDPRLPVHEDVVGIVTPAGTPVAFQRSRAVAALTRGEEIVVEDVRLVLDGGGIRAVDRAGNDLGSHQAFWFAWSQFHPGTLLWGG
ncbi:MAG: DUF3179 domain-containing (seleno)protein [Hasllibacter sp.]